MLASAPASAQACLGGSAATASVATAKAVARSREKQKVGSD